MEISDGELKEDKEGWLAFQQKSQLKIEDIFKINPPKLKILK